MIRSHVEPAGVPNEASESCVSLPRRTDWVATSSDDDLRALLDEIAVLDAIVSAEGDGTKGRGGDEG